MANGSTNNTGLYNKGIKIGSMFNDEYSKQTGVDSLRGGTSLERQSIIGQAKQNIFEFPVFICDTVNIEFATAVNSLLEQVYASFLQMAISAKPMVSGDQIRRGKQFSHLKTDTNKYLEYTDDMTYVHDACHNKIITENGCIYEYEMISYDDEIGKLFNEHMEHEPLSEFSHMFLESDTLDDYKAERDRLVKELSKTGNDRDTRTDYKDRIQAFDRLIETLERNNTDEDNLQSQLLKDTEKNYPALAIDNEIEKINALTIERDQLATDDPYRNLYNKQIQIAQRKIEQLQKKNQ